MIVVIVWEAMMFPLSIFENEEVPRAMDVYTRQFFEFILPELARSVKEYKPAGPLAIRFITGDGHSFYFAITSKLNPDPYMMEWKLVCTQGFYKRKETPSYD